MHAHASFLSDLGAVLSVAAVAGLVFRRLGLPPLIGYLTAGLAVGPAVPLPVFADVERIEALAEFGVVLVMFSVGLEFSLRRLVTVLPRSGLTALVQMSGLACCGFLVGQAFGMTSIESTFLAAAVAISSTMVVARVMDGKTEPRVRELVFGVLVIQDVAAVALIAVLTAIASGSAVSPGEVGAVVGTLVVVLVGMVALGVLVVPRMVRALARVDSQEVVVVTILGLCFGFAILAKTLGYSVAFGAFLAGMLVAESGQGRRIEHLVQPLRDLFAAVFFVSIGMMVDPMTAFANAHVALALALVLIVAQLFTVTIASVLGGNGLRRSVHAGLYLGQIGEFAFIMVAIGTSAGVVDPALLSIVVTVAALTAFTTPLATRRANAIAAFIDRKLPHGLQNLLSLHESWLERARSKAPAAARSRLRRFVAVVTIDGVGLVVIAVSNALLHDRLIALLGELGIAASSAAPLLLVGAILLATPLLFGLIRSSHGLAELVAYNVLAPRQGDGFDLADAPRRVLAAVAQLVIVLAVGAPVVALTQPFLPTGAGIVALAALLVGLTVLFWQRNRNLQGHMRAGAEVLVELLAAQGETPTEVPHFEEILPGLGTIASVRIGPGAFACGRSLAELDVRAKTGASVLAIRRGEAGVITPGGHEPLLAGDVLALSGTSEAASAAERLLQSGVPVDSEDEGA